ncbi:patatin-like phospholipase family protein [Pseudarthrobacter sp. J1738]|uniref:patatin-like phospholipase family protein n=1 Tax=Pseudarthrobacter sp. J1738 TaxID=3420446 RepID=UPI003D293A01
MNTNSSSVTGSHPAETPTAVQPHSTQSHPIQSRQRALVLGGGGSTGNAWLIGVVAGLVDAGCRVKDFDLIVGTSAGATAAAQITSGATPAELFEAIMNERAPSLPERELGGVSPQRSSMPPVAASEAPRRMVNGQLGATGEVIAASVDITDMRRRIGAWALSREASSDVAFQERWRATVASRFVGDVWPEQRVFVTAVDAVSGDPVTFDLESGVNLVDAVAASCSSGFAYQIGENHYVDGGYRTNADNADVVKGYKEVLVLSPFGGRSRTPSEWGVDLASQVSELRSAGSKVATIFPEGEAANYFGVNAMDLSLRPLAAQAGFAQGRAAGQYVADA